MDQTFWTAVLAASSALAGVVISNIATQRRLRTQMEFDEKQKALERLTKLRTDVYLDAAAQIVRMNSFFVQVPQIDPVELNGRPELGDFGAAAAKLAVVAESDTAYHVNELVALFTKTFLKVVKTAMPVHTLHSEASRVQRRFDDANELCTRTNAAWKELLASGAPDVEKSAALGRDVDRYLAQMKDASAEREALDGKHNAALEQFHSELLPMLAATRGPMITTLARLRKDLGLSTETERWTEQMARHGREAENEFQSFMSDMKAHMQAE
jgi:hypothetical protein